MSDPVFLRRTLTGYVPFDDAGQAAHAATPLGAIVKAKITRPRNVGHHRKYWAVLNAIHPHQELYPTPGLLHAAVKAALGYADTIKLDGKVVVVPRSIAFDAMDQDEFEKFWDRFMALVSTRIIPGIDRRDLEREVADIVNGYGVAA